MEKKHHHFIAEQKKQISKSGDRIRIHGTSQKLTSRVKGDLKSH